MQARMMLLYEISGFQCHYQQHEHYRFHERQSTNYVLAERVHLVRVQLNSFGKCLGRERRSRENRTACLCTEVAKNGVAAAMISTLC